MTTMRELVKKVELLEKRVRELEQRQPEIPGIYWAQPQGPYDPVPKREYWVGF